MIIIIIAIILTLLIFYTILRISSICSQKEEQRELIRKTKKSKVKEGK